MVLIDVCGDRYELAERLKLPGTVRFANPSLLELFANPKASHEDRLELCNAYDSTSESYHFARCPELFKAIYGYHLTGLLHCPEHACPERFRGEAAYWKVDFADAVNVPKPRLEDLAAINHVIEETSSRSLLEKGSDQILAEIRSRNPAAQILDLDEAATLSRLRRDLWILLELPSSSLPAKCLELFSVLLIFVSLVTLVAASHEFFQYSDPVTNATRVAAGLVWAESGCIGWFTLEYVLRLLVSPQRIFFITNPYNVVDFASIFPFYLESLLHLFGLSDDDLKQMVGALLALGLIRLFRVARVLKLLKHSRPAKFLLQHMRECAAELGTLAGGLSMLLILSSTTVYYCEKEVEGTEFRSIPHAFWWCIITITTCGYGDMVPATLVLNCALCSGGKLTGSVTAVLGVITMSFPVAVIVVNLSKSYRRGILMRRQRKRAPKLAMLWRLSILNAATHRQMLLEHSPTVETIL